MQFLALLFFVSPFIVEAYTLQREYIATVRLAQTILAVQRFLNRPAVPHPVKTTIPSTSSTHNPRTPRTSLLYCHNIHQRDIPLRFSLQSSIEGTVSSSATASLVSDTRATITIVQTTTHPPVTSPILNTPHIYLSNTSLRSSSSNAFSFSRIPVVDTNHSTLPGRLDYTLIRKTKLR